jgi:hypothetical protein
LFIHFPTLNRQFRLYEYGLPSSGLLRNAALITAHVSEECIASIVRVTRTGELGTLELTSVVDSCHPDDGGDMFLRNVGSYKSHTASHSRRRYSS